MIIYFAGGFEREEQQMSIAKKHGMPFYRLLSFFYDKDLENWFKLMDKPKRVLKRRK